MLQNTNELTGLKLAATDGDIGHIKDFFFDDESWVVRYVVADTGNWLSGREVLLAPRAFGDLELVGKKLLVFLTRQQIEDSPPIESHRPVSRQYEEQYYGHYGWSAYWEGGGALGAADAPVVVVAPERKRRDDVHLRSAKSVVGHHIEATDGAVGTVIGFMIDDKTWAIREIVVQTGHWYAGKEVLITPGKVTSISYADSKVFVNVTKADIQRTAENHLVHAGAGSSAPKPTFTD